MISSVSYQFSIMPSAVLRQVKRSRIRARPAAPRRARSSGSASIVRIAVASAPGSFGGTVSAASPDGPVTSGSAPPVVVTSGAAQLIASMAGSEKPSYSDGTTASSHSA